MGAGLTMKLVPQLLTYGNTPGGISYDENAMASFNNQMRGNINSESILDDKTHQIARVLDMLSLGLWSKFGYLYENYLMGAVTFFRTVYGNFVTDQAGQDFGTWFFGIIETLVNMTYIFGMLTLLGNKNPTGADTS
jgi:hypothetical protein